METMEHEWAGGVEWHHPPDVIDIGGHDATTAFVHDFPLSTVVSLTSVSFLLTTAAGGGARQVLVSLRDGTGIITFSIAAPGTQAGGLAVQYTFAPLLTTYGSSALGSIGGPIVPGKLPYNMSLEIIVTGAAAGDVITAGRLLVNQHPTRHDYGPAA